MKKYIAYCGLDCENCDARIATIENDDEKRKTVAELWSKLNNAEITPDMINCTGCRIEGVKTPYCAFLCPIRQCALEKGVETCGDCGEMEVCEKLQAIVSNNPDAYRYLKTKGLRLIKLTKEYEKELQEMIGEWKEDILANHTNHSPWAIFKNDPGDFDYYLEHLERKEATENRVPDSVFFLLDEERNRLLGAANIRHYLNDALLKEGGHIGDGIRPSERGKGYGTILVALALEECKKLGIDKVLMTCDKDNTASAKTIIHNGGVLENEFVNDDGEIEQRYWITL